MGWQNELAIGERSGCMSYVGTGNTAWVPTSGRVEFSGDRPANELFPKPQLRLGW